LLGVPDLIELKAFGITGKSHQQDAHLRLGFVRAPGAALNVLHGGFPGLEGTLPWDAVVVELAFRNVSGGGTAWQLGDYKGNPLQAGVWAVPAGKSLGAIQGDAALKAQYRLGFLDLLKEFPPPGQVAIKLQVQPDGHWQLLFDILNDGAIDLDLTQVQQFGGIAQCEAQVNILILKDL
jgi:hypothetical protein